MCIFLLAEVNQLLWLHIAPLSVVVFASRVLSVTGQVQPSASTQLPSNVATNADLENLKKELTNTVRSEVAAAKRDILDGASNVCVSVDVSTYMVHHPLSPLPSPSSGVFRVLEPCKHKCFSNCLKVASVAFWLQTAWRLFQAVAKSSGHTY